MSVKFAFTAGEEGNCPVYAQLCRWGHHFDDETIRSVMRELGLVACQPRPFRPVTTIAGDASAMPDLVRRDFTATAPGCKLVGDITYIPTWEGWLYLATVLDCFSKKVVGYAMAGHMRTSLISEALQMAANNVGFAAGETIFHSDRRCQYMSAEFAAFAAGLGVRQFWDEPAFVRIMRGRNRSMVLSRISVRTGHRIPLVTMHELTLPGTFS